MLQMSYITMWGKTIEDWNADEVFENFKILSNSPIMLSELIALLKYNYNRIDLLMSLSASDLIVRWICIVPIRAINCLLQWIL